MRFTNFVIYKSMIYVKSDKVELLFMFNSQFPIPNILAFCKYFQEQNFSGQPYIARLEILIYNDCPVFGAGCS